MKIETRKYEIFETGIYVGVLELSSEQVKKFTTEAVFVLKPVVH